jgi:multiple sugar transport system permease protein
MAETAHRPRFSFPQLLASCALLLALGIIVLPIAWMVLTAFKQPRDVYDLKLFFTPTLENFRLIFEPPWNIGQKLLNSLLVSLTTVAVATPAAMAAAYSFSRFDLLMKRGLFVLLATQFIPAVVVVLPFYLLFRDLGLIDTRIALVLVNLSIVTPFATWMIKGFIDGIPIDSEEAAMVDGATRLRAMIDVVVPMILPGVIVAAVFAFILTWNEFLFALILTREDAVTLPIGIVKFRLERGDLWELMAAAGIIITIPTVFLALVIQRHFVRGLTGGAVR